MKGGTTQACAACKYQRRKCEASCPLAPYFPADQPKMFHNVHRLYGVGNLMKILKNLDTDFLKKQAMQSIIYESNMRRKYPVHGCGIVMDNLRRQIRHAIDELYFVKCLLDKFRKNEQFPFDSGSDCDPTNMWPYHSNLDMTTLPYNHHSNFDMSSVCLNEDKDVGFDENSDVKPSLWTQQQPEHHFDHHRNSRMTSMTMNNALLDMKSPMISQGLKTSQQEIDVSYNDYAYDYYYDDTIAHDQQSYIESKDPDESSAESTLQSTMQTTDTSSKTYQLRNAAAFFSLKNG